MDFLKKVADWLRFDYKGNLDMDKSSQALFLKTLTGKERSFAVIAIRCNSEKSTGKRKMDAGRLYHLLHGYSITSESIAVDKFRAEQNTLYDDYYTELTDGKPHIQISAIVGQNGAGKSSIVEFMMRLINNFAAATIGEEQLGEAAERLHYIDRVDGELWYLLKGYPYHLKVKNCHVRLTRYATLKTTDQDKDVFTEEEEVFDNGGDEACEKVMDVLKKRDDVDLKMVYEQFFYTLISNQSIYAYNTRDYYLECNDDEKECKALGVEGEEYNDEERCWLHGIFHKNDGYKTPMVVTPYRYEGNLDINKENLLATERLVTLLASQEHLRRINGHLIAKGITYSYDTAEVHRWKEVKKLGFDNLTETGYNFLRDKIIKDWDEVLGKKVSENARVRPYYEQAIDYIVYKTLKVSRNYEEHNTFYKKNKAMTNSCDEKDVMAMVKHEAADLSHITRKIFQTIAYIWYEVYELEEKRDDEGKMADSYGSISFDDLGRRWHDKAIKTYGAEQDVTRNYIQRQSLILPPFLCMRIDLCETNKPEVEIDFETLSSGEKQQIYSISSVLYHLDNLKSAQKDESTKDRITYKHITIVLEEIELYYHPELQQQFVKYLIDNLDQMNLEGIEGIHVLIVTHSPYVLSDIPKSNVLALKKLEAEPEENLSTFGANIHDLLKNSFFLSDGSIGKFAQWEVGHILACLDVHRWAKTKGVDTKTCPYIEKVDENEAYRFLNRYTYTNLENRRSRQFSYDYFNQDLSVATLKRRVQMIDEPIVYQVLMRKIVELEAMVEDA